MNETQSKCCQADIITATHKTTHWRVCSICLRPINLNTEQIDSNVLTNLIEQYVKESDYKKAKADEIIDHFHFNLCLTATTPIRFYHLYAWGNVRGRTGKEAESMFGAFYKQNDLS